MKKLLVAPATVFVAIAFSGAALADIPTCGDPQDDTWMQVDAIEKKAEIMGYTIEGMNVTEGNCYEMTAVNVQGQNVRTYLDPRTGDVVQDGISCSAMLGFSPGVSLR